jgi:hypothetical protein
MPLLRYRKYRPNHAAVLVPAPGGGGYTGPGDINGAAFAWYGLRAFDAAYAAPGNNPAIDVVDTATGATQTTINILSTGDLDVATIAALGYAVSVKKIYDQSGNVRHATQATLFNMPALTLSAIGSLPGMTFAGNQYLQSSSISQAQPLTISGVAKRTTFADNDTVFNGASGATGLLFANTTGNMGIYAGGGVVIKTAAENAFHSAQAMFNGASSGLYVDGSNGTGDPGPSGYSAEAISIGGGVLTGLRGVILEVGMWGSDKSANNSSMDSNQHAYWGF